MTLNNYKIPIIVGRNDIPTTNINQSNHPNGAFLVNKYNALIDELKLSINDIVELHDPGFAVYCNSNIGSDNNNGLSSETAVRTIDKALSIVTAKKITWCSVFLTGNFDNPFFDLSKLQVKADNNYSYLVGNIRFVGNFVFNLTANYPLFNLNSLSFFSLRFEQGTFNISNEFSFHSIVNRLRFWGINFTHSGDQVQSFTTNFIDCKDVCLDDCTFNKKIHTNANLMDCFLSTLYVNGCNFNSWKVICHGSSKFENWERPNSDLIIEISQNANLSSISNDTLSVFDGGLALKENKLLTANNNIAIEEATTGTEITTINEILTALRNYGIIPD